MDAIKGIVIYTKPWDMVDESTGERKSGITVEYLMCDNMSPVTGDDGSRGVRHCKQSLPSDKLPNIQQVPGVYELNFALKAGSKGKPEIKLDDLKYIGMVVPIAPAQKAG